MTTYLKSRLAIAEKALRIPPSDEAAAAALSAEHCKTLCAVLKPIAGYVPSDEKPVLCELAERVEWRGEDGATVKNAIFATERPILHEPREKRLRRNMQNYRGFDNYLTEAKWETLLSKDVHMSQKLYPIVSTIKELGGRCVCEHTKTKAVELWLLVSNAAFGENVDRKALRERFSETL